MADEGFAFQDAACIASVLWRGAASTGFAVLAPGRTPLTHAGLFSLTEQTRDALHRCGVGRNDRVAIVLPNGPEMAVAFLAIGAVATSAPLNPGYRLNEF